MHLYNIGGRGDYFIFSEEAHHHFDQEYFTSAQSIIRGLAR